MSWGSWLNLIWPGVFFEAGVHPLSKLFHPGGEHMVKQNKVGRGQEKNIEKQKKYNNNRTRKETREEQCVPWNLFESLDIGVEEDDGPEAAKLRLVHRHLLHLCHQLHQHSAKRKGQLISIARGPQILAGLVWTCLGYWRYWSFWMNS